MSRTQTPLNSAPYSQEHSCMPSKTKPLQSLKIAKQFHFFLDPPETSYKLALHRTRLGPLFYFPRTKDHQTNEEFFRELHDDNTQEYQLFFDPPQTGLHSRTVSKATESIAESCYTGIVYDAKEMFDIDLVERPSEFESTQEASSKSLFHNKSSLGSLKMSGLDATPTKATKRLDGSQIVLRGAYVLETKTCQHCDVF